MVINYQIPLKSIIFGKCIDCIPNFKKRKLTDGMLGNKSTDKLLVNNHHTRKIVCDCQRLKFPFYVLFHSYGHIGTGPEH